MDLYKEIEKNFSKIEKFFTEDSLLKFSEILPGHLEQYNVGLGTVIRINLLRHKNILYRKFIQNGFTDRDEMTMENIREFYKYIHRRI